ncbi:imidazole glycerol phosphate synthase subunit HisH [Pedomonas mirosovicensis]|uniref:imidazole glycerol phosphate synthase subunit HisH n=1 Tax=Pedomonas mirosovicensis TaxID=2908641 RepID=UPI0021683E48|nr:imidazole glycerol phosphate synthase subunit HisH [Pedomonas mirosovicensis]MCH8684031.1 imidazole glycerol phosphate synthase subunit HisH [Pedomonas mirosovicensis]
MAETLVLIDYGSGNLRSAAKAFERAAADLGLDTQVKVSGAPEDISSADRLVLPGVGAYGQCSRALRSIPGLEDALVETVQAKARPFLGICVGMQLLATRGLEHGEHAGLGWIPGEVVPLEPADPQLKIPHMGWNTVSLTEGGAAHPVFSRLPDNGFAYFVHSYHFRAASEPHVLGRTDYGGPVTALVGRDTMIGTQFHPEKSQGYGLALLRAFLEWRP